MAMEMKIEWKIARLYEELGSYMKADFVDFK